MKDLKPDTPLRYTGRFAPSPTGALHMGSLVTALASYLDARSVGGRWLLRIEDIDPPRQIAGATQSIFTDLGNLGFEWDGKIMLQSERSESYEAALKLLQSHTFNCTCSRSDQAARIYDGRCRHQSHPDLISGKLPNEPVAIRIRVAGTVMWTDRSGAKYQDNLVTDCGDFVLRRRDQLWAYQLAVAVDDAEQGITHVVRGADLIDSTARQMLLQRLLNYPHPQYLHVPVVLAEDGEKLSKQNGAVAVSTLAPLEALKAAWQLLTGKPISANSIDSFWRKALKLFYRHPEASPPVWLAD